MASGWARLGDALGGISDADRSRIEAQTIAQLSQRDRNIASARNEIEKARALDSLGDYFQAIGVGNPNEMAGIARSGANLNQLMGGAGKIQEMRFRQAARDAAVGGDMGTANSELMGIASGPVELPKVAGGVLLSNRLIPGGGEMSVTPVGQSQINANEARAQASIINANKPRSTGGSSSSGSGKLTPVQKARMDAELYALKPLIDLALDEVARESARPTGLGFERAKSKLDELRKQQNDIFDKYEAGTRPSISQAIPSTGAVDFVIDDPENIPPQVIAQLGSLAEQLAPKPVPAPTGGQINQKMFDLFQGSLTGQKPPARPTSKEEYDSLPKGTKFIAPDGTTRIKP